MSKPIKNINLSLVQVKCVFIEQLEPTHPNHYNKINLDHQGPCTDDQKCELLYHSLEIEITCSRVRTCIGVEVKSEKLNGLTIRQ